MALALSVTSGDLGKRIGKSAPADSAMVARLFEEASTLLEEELVTAWRPMPPEVQDDCVLRIGQALWDASKTSSGAGPQTSADGPALPRSPRDPLASSRTLIGRYVVPL